MALAGGTTPRAAYDWLVLTVDDWTGVELWFGDERALPAADPGRNETMATESLIEPAGIDPGQVHPMPAVADAEAAAAYAELLRERVPPAEEGGPPALDLVLLGLGEDGHVCSLFPGHPALEVTTLTAAITDAPKPPPERVTLTLPVLRAARRRLIMVAGEGKRAAVAAAVGASAPDRAVPVSLLPGELTDLVTDTAAAPQ